MNTQDFKDSIHERLTANCRLDGDCWIWTSTIRRGQPVIKIAGVTVSAARAAFWVYRGDSEQFDLFADRRQVHRVGCRNARCVNFEHLEAVLQNRRQAA